jgi:hypothetical protein
MKTRTTSKVWCIATALCLVCLAARADERPLWEPRPGQTIVILGNTFAERMAMFGYFETFLHARFPDHNLRVRNMGWSADTVDMQPRPYRFGALEEKLGPPKSDASPRDVWFNGLGADVIIACFGMTESFRGRAGLDPFRKQLDAYLRHHASQKYNGRTPPQIVLISPVAHENLGGHWPDPAEHNEHLARYVEVMRQVATEHDVPFVDLYTPHRRWMEQHAEQKLTINGIHLSELGDWHVSRWIAQALGLFDGSSAGAGGESARALRLLVNQKNERFLRHFRAVNGEYIYGRRVPVYLKDGPRPEIPHLSDEEMRALSGIADVYDRKIWAAERPDPAAVWADRPAAR